MVAKQTVTAVRINVAMGGRQANASASPGTVMPASTVSTPSMFAMEKATDHYVVRLCTLVVLLVFAELKQNAELFSRYLLLAQQLAADFTRNCLPCFKQLTADEPDLFRTHICGKSVRGLPKSSKRGAFRQMIFKLRIMDQIFNALDVFVFPKTWHGHQGGVKSLYFSELENTIVLTGGFDGLVKIVDMKTVQCLGQFVGHRSIVTAVAFAKRDQYIVSASFDHTLKVWNSQNASCLRTLEGHEDGVLHCTVSPDNRFIASCGMDNTVRYWELSTGQCKRVFRGHTNWVKVCRFAPDGSKIMSAGMDRKVNVWEIGVIAGTEKPQLKPYRIIENVHSDYVLDMAVCKPCLLLTTSRDRTVKLLNWMSGEILYSVSSTRPSWSCCVAFSQCGRLFATGSFDSFLVIHNTKTGERLREIKVHNHGILSLQFSINRDYLVVGTTEGTVQQVYL